MNYNTTNTVTLPNQGSNSLDNITDEAAQSIGTKQAGKTAGYGIGLEAIICPGHLGPGIWAYAGLESTMDAWHHKVVHSAAHIPELFGYEESHAFGHDVVELALVGALTVLVGRMANNFEEEKAKLEDQVNTYIENNPNATQKEIKQHLRGNKAPLMKKLQNPTTYLQGAQRKIARKARDHAEKVREHTHYTNQALKTISDKYLFNSNTPQS